jgi:DNA repair exonuclease SbcCD nuclease subunit
MRIVHAADLHIDSALHGLGRLEADAPLDVFRLATRRAFDNLVELCLTERASLLLLAGDIFDAEWKDYNSGIFFVRRLAHLAANGCETVVLRGNHDAASKISYDDVRLPSGAHLLPHDRAATLAFEKLGVAVHGQSYASEAIEKNLARDYPKPVAGAINVGMLHTNAIGDATHANYAPCTVPQLEGHGYDYWALGHVHTRAVLSERPWIVYPGNLQGRHIGETGAKGCTVIDVEDGRIASVTAREVDVARWAMLRVDASALASVDAIVEAVREAAERAREASGMRPMLARVRIEGETPLHAQVTARGDALKAALRGAVASAQDVWAEKIAIATRAPSSSSRAAVDGTLLEALASELAAIARDVPSDYVARLAPIADKTKRYIDRLDDEARVRALLPEIEAILASRLAGATDEDET